MDFKTPVDSPQWLYALHQDQISEILSQYKGPVDSTMLEEWIIAVSQVLCVNQDSRFRTAFQRLLRVEIKGVLRDQIINPSGSIAPARSSESRSREAPSYFVYFFEMQCLTGYEGWSTSIADICIAYEKWRPMSCAPSMGKNSIGSALTLLGITKHITNGKTHYNVKLRTT